MLSPPPLSPSPFPQGNLVDLHGKVIRYVDYNPEQQDPVYTGPLQVLGPGFAPFKPYVRPPYFYTRVSCYIAGSHHVHVHLYSTVQYSRVSLGSHFVATPHVALRHLRVDVCCNTICTCILV